MFEAKQARSRRTLDRLLDSAELVLDEVGLQGATVPMIANRAGVSVGVVYRRFRDKDALLRAAYQRFFERTLELNRAVLAPEHWVGKSAAQIVDAVVRGMVEGHKRHRGLLRALFTFITTHGDEEFRRRATELNNAATEQVALLIRERSGGSTNPDPERATTMAILVIGSALRRWIEPEGERVFPVANEEELATELSRIACAYLGVQLVSS